MGDEGVAVQWRGTDAGAQGICDPHRGEHAALDGARAGGAALITSTKIVAK